MTKFKHFQTFPKIPKKGKSSNLGTQSVKV